MEKKLELKHHKDFHKAQFQKLTTTQRNLTFALCYKLMNQESNLLEFDVKEIIKMTGYRPTKKGDNIYIHLKKTYDILKHISIKIDKINGFKEFVLFTVFETFEDTGKVKISVNSEYRYLLNQVTKPFTLQNLVEYTDLKSNYSQLLYSLLKEWDLKKERIFSIEEFREELAIPESYDFKEITRRVLAQILKELPKYFKDLTLDKIKTGRKITSLKFTWKNSKITKVDANISNPEVEYIEDVQLKNSKTLEYTFWKSEQGKKWFYKEMGTVKLNNKIISVLETFKSEKEAKNYLLDVKKSNLDSALMASYILKKERPSEIITTPKKKKEIVQEVVNQDVMDLLEKPQPKEENKSIYTKDLLGIQQYLYAKTMYLKTMTIGEKTRLINNLKSIEEAIQAGERLEIDMTFFKLEEPKIVIEVAPEPEIQKESVKEKPQNNNQDKENLEFKETLAIIQNKVEDLEISMLEKIKLKMKIVNCTKLDEIVNICIEYKINL
ncbi:MAG: replication initiation protein [Fusobacteriaceae bacterium]